MTRWFLFAMLLCIAAAAQDQLPGPLQPCVSSASNGTCVFAHNVTSGHVLLIGASSSTDVLTTPTELRSTTLTLLESNTNSGANAYVWCGIIGTTGAETITLTSGGTIHAPQINAVELPASVGCTRDGTAHSNGSYSGSPSTVTLGPITTLTNGDFVFSYISGASGGGLLLPISPVLTLSLGEGNGSDGTGYNMSGTAGAYSAAFKNSSNTAGGWCIVALKPSSIQIVTASLPTAALGIAYSYTLQTVGGAGAYTYSLSSGSLPSGLTLSSGGVISGTPTGPTTVPTVQVTDGTHTTTASLAVTVNSAASSLGFVQSVAAGASGQIAMTVTAGHLILIPQGLNNFGGNTPWTTPTDSIGTVYKFINGQAVNHLGLLAIFYGIPASSGAITIQGAFQSGQNAIASEFSNAQAFFDIQGETTGTNTGVATLTGPSLTTLVPNSEVWAAVGGAGLTQNATWNAGTGYTIETLGNAAGIAVNAEHANKSTPSSYSPTFSQLTSTGDGGWIIQAVALRPTTTGPVSGQYRHKGWIF